MVDKKEKEASVQLIAVLELLKTGYWYDRKVREVLLPFEVSHEQFNVLRILEHNHPKKFSLKEVQSRLMNKTANTTRLVEKLKQRGLIKSAYSKTNRRMLQINLTSKGLELLHQIRKPLFELNDQVIEVMTNQDAEELVRILRQFRSMK